MTFHVMIIPTLDCPSNCAYCWGSKKGSGVMDIEIVKEIVTWLDGFRDDYVHFTFHGGEPLLAGYDFYKEALPILKNASTHKEAGFSLQSNLWLINQDLAKLFAEYGVAISTSIDGPREINDYQRGKGYFDKTMEGYKTATENGVKINFICTFTSYSKDFEEEIYNFFLENRYNMKLHAALPSMRGENADPWALEQEDHGKLLIQLLDRYLNDLDKIEIKDFDHICKSSFRRRGTLCTFADCMGDTLAIGHDGSIYPCYRFNGMEEWIMGNVKNKPSMKQLMKSEAWQKLMDFKDFVDENCGDCTYIKFCRGGCPYNGIVATGTAKSVDPQCTAYKMIFKEVSNRANKDFLKSSIPPIMGENTVNKHETKKKYSIMDLMLKQ
ncbi:TIGR04083 family peptide-modifying radical SAM enzyme [Methanobrevibacter sp. TMH8]|uniref:TIGR04083 family peptide-modifying radical SAM enzyme n=1 Tax=Methanobrevibacter sp. TMH8 TaxID=2848611 RepID=UPI001CCC1D6E|nr:TIGR04083 family peptide-modifying radical SAM enzyme [Methanobrevibacter sp. TMH8]MBZ9571013.1 TIGR04083 family peptide-modifying radical SAM enzyme [Methanobrevibacter sp. TMH8]